MPITKERKKNFAATNEGKDLELERDYNGWIGKPG